MLFQLCLNFYSRTSRYPLDFGKDRGDLSEHDLVAKDVCDLENLRVGLAEAHGLKAKTLPDSVVPHLAQAQLSPACAVTGGVLAQEVSFVSIVRFGGFKDRFR